MRTASPLRYPGGKWRLTGFFQELLESNFASPPGYIEPYAGGGSLALSLLFTGRVSNIWLNDLDPAIHACWSAILDETNRFCDALADTPVTLEEWRTQKEIYRNGLKSGTFELGFATFYLNRTNHSGILNGGVIGGKSQIGDWKIDARFNREELAHRITRIREHRKQIKLTNLDAQRLLGTLRQSERSLVYLDPPYVGAGKALYLNAYVESDHRLVRDRVLALKRLWVISYDDVALIHTLYDGLRSRRISLNHTARVAKVGREVLYFSKNCVIPAAE